MTGSGATRFLLDGFPHKLEQLAEFQEQIKPCDGVLVFTVPEEVAVERLVARGAASGRAEDSEETIRARMEVFGEEAQPVIEALLEAGANVCQVDASGGADEV
ncbi:Uridylate kinase, partial [Tetrabaena socialis]